MTRYAYSLRTASPLEAPADGRGFPVQPPPLNRRSPSNAASVPSVRVQRQGGDLVNVCDKCRAPVRRDTRTGCDGMSKSTIIRWSFGDVCLYVETPGILSPEAIETLTHRTGREFTMRNRELEAGANLEDATEADTLAALEADDEG